MSRTESRAKVAEIHEHLQRAHALTAMLDNVVVSADIQSDINSAVVKTIALADRLAVPEDSEWTALTERERTRQMVQLNYTPDHDAHHTVEEWDEITERFFQKLFRAAGEGRERLSRKYAVQLRALTEAQLETRQFLQVSEAMKKERRGST